MHAIRLFSKSSNVALEKIATMYAALAISFFMSPVVSLLRVTVTIRSLYQIWQFQGNGACHEFILTGLNQILYETK